MVPSEKKNDSRYIAIKIHKQIYIHPKLRRILIFVYWKMIDVFAAAGLNILLCLPVSLVLLDSDIDTYSSRRSGWVNLESAKHGIVGVASVLGTSASSNGRSGIIPALFVLLGIAAEQTSDSRDDDRKIAHGQCHSGLKGTDDGLPNTGDANDQDCMGEGGYGGGHGTGEDRNQTEANGGSNANISKNPKGCNDQEDVGESLG